MLTPAYDTFAMAVVKKRPAAQRGSKAVKPFILSKDYGILAGRKL